MLRNHDPALTMGYRAQLTNRARLLLILGLSWALLTWQLGERSLWNDELDALEVVHGSPLDTVANASAIVHPPLYFLALNLWSSLAGQSDFAVRWLSVAISLVAVAAMPSLASAWLGPRAAVPATLLLGVMPAFIEFGRMSRYYSLLVVLGILSTKFLHDALRTDQRKYWVAYIAAGLALVYTFYPSGMLLAAHGLLAISRWRRWLLSNAIVACGLAPWLFFVVSHQLTYIANVAVVEFSHNILGFILGIADSLYTFSVGETIFPWRPETWLGLIAITVLIISALARRASRAGWQAFGVFGTCVVGMSLLITYVVTGTPFLNVPVRALFALPFYLLLLTAGWLRIQAPRAQALVLGTVLCIWGISNVNDYRGEQFLNPIYLTPAKQAAEFVRQHASGADYVISDSDSVFARYYLSTSTSAHHSFTDQVSENESILRTENPQRIWLVTLGRDRNPNPAPIERLRELLASNYRLNAVERFLPIDPFYLKVKNLLLQRPSYEYRLTVEQYVQKGS